MATIATITLPVTLTAPSTSTFGDPVKATRRGCATVPQHRREHG
jgi:hypothetical protein